MAFNADFFGLNVNARSNTTVLANATTPRAPSIHTYQTTDTLATCDGAGYFSSIRNNLQVGDAILVSVINSSGVYVDQGWLYVKDKSATAVDTTDETTTVSTDSD
ncbi:MAG: hypothetical protein AB7Q04_12940 [Steroidobacteraceae bacterium]